MVAYNENIPKCTKDSHVRFEEGDASSVMVLRCRSLLHRMALMITCLMTAMYAVGAVQKKSATKPVAKKTSLTESELRTLAKAVPDINNVGLLYSVALATSNNVERKQEYLKVVAACLIACDKRDVYIKYVKGKLLNAVEFEGELKEDCKQCSGVGTKKSHCNACKGSGQCPFCKGSGQTKTVRYANRTFNKYYESKPCSKCNESGRCQRCDGEGTIKGKCWTCAGTGKAFSKTVAARVFHDSCNIIADNMNVHAVSNNAKVDSEGRIDLEKEGAGYQKGVKADTAAKKIKEPRIGKRYQNDGRIVYADGSVVTIPYGTIKLTQLELRNGDVLKIVIPSSVKSIGPNAFYNCENLTDVTIPNSVTSIGPYAFGHCKNLKSVTIPDSVTSIGPDAFQNCESLTGVTIANSVGSIGRGAFKDCKNLKSVKLPDQLKDIGDSLFLRCSTLESVVIPPGVTNIGEQAFCCCPVLKSILIPDSVDTISDSAFDKTCLLEKSDTRRNADRLAVVRKAEKLFFERCKVGGEGAEVEYYGLYYCIVKNTIGTYNFVVGSGCNPNTDSSFMIFPTPDSRNLWYAAVVECTEKIKSWIRISAENKVKHVSKEIPIGGEVYAYVNGITRGNGQRELMWKAVREPVTESVTQLVRFRGSVETLDDTFSRYRISIGMTCGFFNRRIFSVTGITKEIDNEIVEFLTFIDPERLENARETQAKKEDLFQ